jgi:4-carboxymuconolactone decarboxylase
LPPLPPDEAAVFNYGMELLKTRRVRTATFQAVLDLLGAQGLVELTTLMGFYTMLAFNANAVDLDLPSELKEMPLPV